MAEQWNEKLSNELKKLNLVKNPSAAQKAKIASLKATKAGKGPTAVKAAADIAGNFSDPAKVAQAQTVENQKTAEQNIAANRVNETNAFGNRTYNADGSITDNLSQGQQGLLNQQTQTGTLGSNVAGGLLGGLQGQGAYNAQQFNQFMPQGSDQARQQTYDATYGQLTRDLSKNKARDQQSLEQSLADRGIPIGSKQYNDQVQQFNQRYDDQEMSARNQATLTGNQAFEQSFNQGQTNYQNQLGAYNSNYNMPASIAGQLQGLGQVQAPTFGQGFVPIEQQGTNYGDIYGTSASARAAAAALAKQGGGGGGGGQQAPQQPSFIPSMGGVAGAGVPTNQPPRVNPGQNLANAGANGFATGVANNLLRP